MVCYADRWHRVIGRSSIGDIKMTEREHGLPIIEDVDFEEFDELDLESEQAFLLKQEEEEANNGVKD
jgi:hypothetical protein